MAVLKTTSPDRSAGAPKLLPSKTVPSSKARIAGFNSGCSFLGVDKSEFSKVWAGCAILVVMATDSSSRSGPHQSSPERGTLLQTARFHFYDRRDFSKTTKVDETKSRWLCEMMASCWICTIQ